ncbi:MAG: hypothetical protein VX188_02255 [Candidatus Thermoplasmatota archaeon]|nr:hypothetical protein [Candidatus Thermoplasmatota archaeon]
MRILTILSALFVLSIIFLPGSALSEKLEYSNLVISEDETVVFDEDQVWLGGDILIDGELIIQNSHINVNLSLDFTITEIRINSTGKLNLINTTVTAMENGSTYTLVSDQGNVTIQDSQIYYGMIWLVGGNASITNLSLDGYGLSNYGIFSEDTNLTASGVSIRNYTQGLRAIGSSPTLESMFYLNCSTWMTQEWWVTFSPVDESTGLPITGFQVRQWTGDGRMIGTWNWAKQFEIDSQGQVVNHTANFTSYLNLNFAYIEDEWGELIVDNTDMMRTYDLNHHNVSYDSAILFVDGSLLASGQIVPKWSEINISVMIDNPTDMNFNNLFLNLAINGEPGFTRTSFKLPAGSSLRMNLTWIASIEGPLSLGISTVVVDYSDNLTDYDIALSRFVEVETSVSSPKSSDSWLALLTVFMVLTLCSYILYSGMEDDMESYDTGAEEEFEVEEDEHLREMALPQENEEEKEN